MTWHPKSGDYVWHEHHGLYPGCPSQVIRPSIVDSDPQRWLVRALTGSQKPLYTDEWHMEPMNAMEVLAIVHAWPDVIL